jgi:hypothetical protein
LHVHTQVEPIPERARQPPAIALHDRFTAAAFAPGISEEPARTSPRCLFVLRPSLFNGRGQDIPVLSIT